MSIFKPFLRLPMHPSKNRLPRFIALVLCAVASSQAASSDWEWGAQIHVDTLLYRDNQRGRGEQWLEESVGIHNVHGAKAHAHGSVGNGLNLRQVEAHLSATWANSWQLGLGLMAATGGNTAIEEAWLASEEGSLPGGLGIKLGKFPANLGLSNALHPHERPMALAPLAQTLLMGGTASTRGVELTWQPGQWLAALDSPWAPTFSLSWSKGENAGFANFMGPTAAFIPKTKSVQTVPFDSQHSALGQRTLQVRISPVILSTQWDAGAWIATSKQHQELHEPHPGVNNAVHGLQGSSRTQGQFLAWNTSAPLGEWGLKAEHWKQTKNLRLTFHELQPALVGQPRDLQENAFSLLTHFAPNPRWWFAAQVERVGNVHEASRARSTVGPRNTSYFVDPIKRHSLIASWSPTKGHQLALQASQTRIPLGNAQGLYTQKVNQLMVWYVFSLEMGTPSHRH